RSEGRPLYGHTSLSPCFEYGDSQEPLLLSWPQLERASSYRPSTPWLLPASLEWTPVSKPACPGHPGFGRPPHPPGKPNKETNLRIFVPSWLTSVSCSASIETHSTYKR